MTDTRHERRVAIVNVIRAAAVQLSPVLYSREGTVERVVDKIEQLARQDVQFATFPETVIPYYPYFSYVQRPFEIQREHLKLVDQAVTIPSPAVDAISAAARAPNMVVSVGVNEPRTRSILQNPNKRLQPT